MVAVNALADTIITEDIPVLETFVQLVTAMTAMCVVPAAITACVMVVDLVQI